jgi:methionyl-tRNA formyltransferase
MRIVFFGSPETALPSFQALLKAGHRIVLAVTQPDRPSGRGQRIAACPVKRFAVEQGIPVVQPERIRKDAEITDRLALAAPDIQVVVAYGQIIPRSVIDVPPLSTINVHYSILPKYRGASPVAWAILNGETKTGVTIFRLNEKMDEGDVYATAETEILPEETAGELEARLSALGARLLVETLTRVEELTPVPQDHARATLAPKLRKEDGKIDWSRNDEAVARLVRAMTPWPSAFTFLRGERLIVLRGSPAGSGDPARPRGTILAVEKPGLVIACAGGTAYRITRLQPEGRRPMDAQAYALGGKLKEGDVLG